MSAHDAERLPSASQGGGRNDAKHDSDNLIYAHTYTHICYTYMNLYSTH